MKCFSAENFSISSLLTLPLSLSCPDVSFLTVSESLNGSYSLWATSVTQYYHSNKVCKSICCVLIAYITQEASDKGD